MLRRLSPALALFLAGCGAAREEAVPERTPPPASAAPDHQHGRLIGLGARDLDKLLGTPALQVREGAGLKLQYRGGGCVLDAYLYPPEHGGGTERVTYVDTRRPSGDSIDRAACEASIEAAR